MYEMWELLRIQSVPCKYLQLLFIEFLIEAEDAVTIVNSRSLMNFSVGILQTLVKLVLVEILELITCSGTCTGVLVKRTLTSNETKVSSSGFTQRCLIFLMKSLLSLTKDEVLSQ